MGFRFPRIKSTVGDLRRLRAIVTILFEEGFSFLVDELRLRYLVS